MNTLILELENLLIRLILIFGVIFLDYLIVLTVRLELFHHSLEKSRYYALFSNLMWAILILANLAFLQYLPLLANMENTYHKGLELDRLIWQNTDLQLVVMFYFSYMLKEKVSVFINVLIACLIPLHYIGLGVVDRWSNNFVAVLGVLLVLLCSWIIKSYNNEWLSKKSSLLLSAVCFSASWGILLLPAFGYDFIDYLRFIFSFTFLMFLVYAINALIRRQISYYRQMEDAAYTDLLTSVGNRNAFDRHFQDTVKVCKQLERPLSFAIMDIDYFKSFNDRYGHLTGDQVLREVADISKEVLTELGLQDQIFRIGGEEFGFIFRDKHPTETIPILEKISQKIYKHVIIESDHQINVSVSFGLSELKTSDKKTTDFYQRVDKYLYHSKKNGRGIITSEGKLIKEENQLQSKSHNL